MSETGENTEQIITEKSYDDVPYPSYPFPDTHPHKLATTAILFGMTPAPVNHCRVLELGCGSGNNLIGMACELPDSKFTGIDLSIHEIEIANKKIQDLDIKNILISHMSITDVTPEFGQFDYIIAHGVYSWVPDDVREKVLCICRDNLSANGVAFISYNTFPGWHFDGMLREMMIYHVKDIKDPAQAIKKARAFMQFLAAEAQANTPYSLFLKNEITRTSKLHDNYFAHDNLSGINQPFYFYEFIQSLKEHHLKYLRECELQLSTALNFNENVKETLSKLGDDTIAIEQHIDFILNRTFRETLVCREDASIHNVVTPENIKDLYFLSTLTPKEIPINYAQNIEITFSPRSGPNVTSKGSRSKALWGYLAMNFPNPLNIESIVSGTLEILQKNNISTAEMPPDKILTNHILGDLLWGISKGFIQLYTTPIPLALTVNEKPLATPHTRHEAAHYNWVTNQLHERITIDNFSHHLIPHLDGKNDINALIEQMIKLIESGKINIQKDGASVTDHEILKNILKAQIELLLKYFVRAGILTG